MLMTKKVLGAIAAAGLALGIACNDSNDGALGGITDNGSNNGGGSNNGSSGGGTGSTSDGGGSTGSSGGSTGGTSSASEGALATFSSAEVAGITQVVNEGEVAQGQIALQRATSPEVRVFAQQMVNEHSQALQRMQAALGQNAPPPASDPTSQLLAHQDQLVAQDLSSQTGMTFDLAYMTTQIAAHAKVLSMIDKSLLPSVGGAGGNGPASDDAARVLQTELTSMRASVLAHLTLALRVQQTLRAAGGARDGGAANDGGAGNDGGAVP